MSYNQEKEDKMGLRRNGEPESRERVCSVFSQPCTLDGFDYWVFWTEGTVILLTWELEMLFWNSGDKDWHEIGLRSFYIDPYTTLAPQGMVVCKN